MAEERIQTIYRHLNSGKTEPDMLAYGVQNPMRAVAQTSSYSETRKPSRPRKFKYTNDCPKLSREQKLFYEQNGFIVIPELVPLENLERYKQRFQEICDKNIHIPGLTVMKDLSYVKSNSNCERIINKIQDFVYDDVLFEYCNLPQILDYVECFCGPNIKAMHTMLINKPPDSGSLTSRHPLHQDLHYFPFRPADRIVCSWTAMERVTKENGCLVAIPGTHKGELLEHGYPDWEGGVNKMFHGVSHLENGIMERRIYLEMNAGDTVFFHPILIHGSGANRTKGFRKAISCHYAASECFYIDVKGTIQEDATEEILEVLRKKGVYLDDLTSLWAAKSRLIRGEEDTL